MGCKNLDDLKEIKVCQSILIILCFLVLTNFIGWGIKST